MKKYLLVVLLTALLFDNYKIINAQNLEIRNLEIRNLEIESKESEIYNDELTKLTKKIEQEKLAELEKITKQEKLARLARKFDQEKQVELEKETEQKKLAKLAKKFEQEYRVKLKKEIEQEKLAQKEKEKSKFTKIIKAQPHKTFKSYMSWTALSKSSPQGKLAAKATKDSKTAIMMYEGRYLVALGKAYGGKIGEKIDIVLESGQVIPAILGDWKATQHTINNSTTIHDGSIVEFIVSNKQEAAKVTKNSGSYDIIFSGKVKEFRK